MEEILDDYFEDDEYCFEENEFPPIRKNRKFRTLPIKYVQRPNISRPSIDKTFEIKPLCHDSRLLIARDFFNDNIDIENIVNDGDGYTFAQFRQSCLDKLYGEITKHV